MNRRRAGRSRRRRGDAGDRPAGGARRRRRGDRSRGGRGRRHATSSAQVRARAGATTRIAAGGSAPAAAAPTRGTCSSRPGRGRSKAPLAIVMHGYGEFSGYDSMSALIRHTVRKGSIVDLPALADRHRDPVPGPVRHRAVHEVGCQRHPRRPCLPPGEAEATSAAATSRGRATSASPSAGSSRRTSRTGIASCTCRSRGRSSSTIRTTVRSPGWASRRSTTPCRASRRR